MSFSPKQLIWFCLLAGLVLVSCASANSEPASLEDPWGTVRVARVQSIRIGFTMAGFEAGINRDAEEQLRGAEMAVTDYGRIQGWRVDLATLDVQCSEGGGRSAALTQTNDPRIVAIIGPTCSASCIGSVSIYDEGHYTVISPSCGASSLTDHVMHNDAFLRTMYDDAHEGELAARFAYLELGARRAAIIDDGTPNTASAATAFEALFGYLGGEIVARETVTPGSGDARSALMVSADAGADLIYAPLLPDDAVSMVIQKATADLGEVPLLGGRYYWSNWFLGETGYTANGIYASGPVLSGPAYETLVQHYIERYDEPPSSPVVAYAYDATMLLLSAIERVAISGPDGLYIGRQALRQALYDTTTYSGVTGVLTCSNWGDCSVHNSGIGQVRDGQWTTVYLP